MITDLYSINDKKIIPFLLISSEVKLMGTYVEGDSVYFNFTPKTKVIVLISCFYRKTAHPVQAKDLMDSVEAYRDIVRQAKTNVIDN